VILHYGAIDPIVTQDKVEQVRAAIADRPNFELHVYPDANHGFYNDVRPAFYNKAAAATAHARTMAGMRAALGPR
jgi:carboxymethylenebutenolidase